MFASGRGSNLEALLAAIAADDGFGGEVALVVSDREDAGALDLARRDDIALLATPVGDDRRAWEASLLDELARHSIDVVVLAGFMRVLSASFVATWEDRILNTHPSLLPAFPGAHAVRDALDYGVRVTGATVHFVEAQVDAGPIIAQRAVEVRDGDDEAALHARIRAVEHQLLPECVRALCQGRIERRGRQVRVAPDDEEQT